MRRVLVLGGTGWLGREIAQRAVAEGADVTCLARGESGSVPDGSRLVPVDRLSPYAYDGVTGQWDDVIELSSDPRFVGPALEALASSAAHWTLVSSVSVYSRNDEPDADESAAVVEPRDTSNYADAKVAAELISLKHLGDRLLVARPGLIVGPGDPSDRFGYWPARFSRTGPALIPTTADRFVQAIDVSDLASWIERAGRDRLSGVVNAVGEVVSFSEFLRAAAAAARYDGELVEVDDDVLLAHDVGYWAGPRSLPLWLPLTDVAFAQRSGAAYLASGGIRRSLSETLSRVHADELARGIDRERRSGLSAVDEQEILRSAH
ncbi:NAD-dependent epimerase/dehydratase family protein [Agreia pratensis]|uniref:Nucleoside-diphosphate-sugar epimerase n=1 Tax=Agreia pratensis TaxID=150121 RepID=A0A1X7KU80_9MICO|nr:NAD-dependent epimerase/dehydratase family protein [Agreia pratensis]SMG45115.1 Nucleoside-diphosphate-sugar epimerase [Agreia pratensis]